MEAVAQVYRSLSLVHVLCSFRKGKEKVFHIKVLPAFERIQHEKHPLHIMVS